MVASRPLTNKLLVSLMKLNDVTLSSALVKNIFMASLIGAGFVLAIEPNHTLDLPMLAAYGLWATHFFFASTMFVIGIRALKRLGCSDPISTLASAVVLPPLFALVSLGLDYGFGKPDEELVSAQPPLTIFLSEVAAVAPMSLAVALAVMLILRHAASPATVEQPEKPSKTEATGPSLNSLIASAPPSLGDDIIRMHAQDHYVEVVTTKGSTLLTEQFGDCVKKLSKLDGIQCHRSHWICLAHAKDMTRKGSSYTCFLSNGDQVPVSRRRYSELKTRFSFVSTD